MKTLAKSSNRVLAITDTPIRSFAGRIIFFISLLITVLNVHGVVPDSTNYITTRPSDGEVALYSDNSISPFYVNSSDYTGVQRALTDLQQDFLKVTGALPNLVIDQQPNSAIVLIAGTLGKSALIDTLIAKGKIDTLGLTRKWEKFHIQTVSNPFPDVDKAVVIIGSDKRGTIFGIYDLSEKIGVSPWHYWADVPVQTKDEIHVKAGLYTAGTPAVKYRGIFLNDEDPALGGWANATFGKLNHQFYEHVFELILRLKGNYLWPAMWGKSLFEDDPLSDEIADEYGIVIGTSHHEPMHRAHSDWSRNGRGDWNYETNENVLKEFWREGIERKGDKEGLVTVGMRGDGDEAMTSGTAIPLLERIVADQRTIIEEVTGKPAEETPQVWALYKEVQDYYDQGMEVPDDVTLLFADDNWGNIRRLPAPEVPKRKGGYGVYYHFDYVGGPRSYRWVNTNPLPRIWEQMNLAYEHGVDQIWVVNVGDLKPMEFPISFFLDMAWAPQQWTADKIDDYSTLWAKQQFGEEHAEPIADYLARYGKYNGRRKPELLNSETFSLMNYNEAEGVLTEYKTLENEVDSVGELLSSELQDAYFQLVEHPVDACANLLDMYVNLGKNKLYSFQGRASANAYGDIVHELFDKDADITDYYHKQVADGKWNRMMSQDHIGYTSWDSPGRNIRPSITSINVPGKANMGVAVSGEEGFWPGILELTISVDAFHQQSAFIEIFNRGRSPFSYQLAYDTTALNITPSVGIISDEQRLSVAVNWAAVSEGIDTLAIQISGPEDQTATVYVKTFKPDLSELEQTEAFIENNGTIAMEADHFTNEVTTAENSWLVIPDLGCTGSGLTTTPSTSASVTPGGNSPHVKYSTYFVTTGSVRVKAYLSPTINYLARPEGMRYGISFDEKDPKIVSFNGDTDSGRANNIIVTTTTHEITEAGLHELNYWMVDPGVVVQKIVIETGTPKNSYLGAPEQAYTLQEKLFVTAAKIVEDDSAQVMIRFNEPLDTNSINRADFSFFKEDALNEIVEVQVSDEKEVLQFTLSEEYHANQLVTFDYVPGKLQSKANKKLEGIHAYVIQMGEYEDEEPSDDPNIYIEVEDGVIGSNWERRADGYASNSAYLTTKDGHEMLNNASLDEADWITLTFKVCDAGTHTFWARANTPSPNDDSFWIKMDEGDWIQWNGIPAGNGWEWVDLGQSFDLDTAYHTLYICMREDGSFIDKVCFQKAGKRPTGVGEGYTECENTTGITELMNGSKSRHSIIYPIPVQNVLFVQSQEAFDELVIYDITGREKLSKHFTQPIQSEQLSMEGIRPGIHFISIKNSKTHFHEMHKYMKK